jgi:hypothetical protein
MERISGVLLDVEEVLAVEDEDDVEADGLEDELSADDDEEEEEKKEDDGEEKDCVEAELEIIVAKEESRDDDDDVAELMEEEEEEEEGVLLFDKPRDAAYAIPIAAIKTIMITITMDAARPTPDKELSWL